MDRLMDRLMGSPRTLLFQEHFQAKIQNAFQGQFQDTPRHAGVPAVRAVPQSSDEP
jgi:hypothetical protein